MFDVCAARVWHSGLERMKAGARDLRFASVGDDGRPLASGIYFYRATVNGQQVTRKLVIAR